MSSYEMGDVYEVVMTADVTDMGRASQTGIQAARAMDAAWAQVAKDQQAQQAQTASAAIEAQFKMAAAAKEAQARTNAETAEVKKLDDAWKRAMSDWRSSMISASSATGDAEEPTKNLRSSVSGLGRSAVSMVASFLTLRTALGVAQTFAEQLKSMQDYAMRTAKETSDFRSSLRDIHAMQGTGPSGVDEAYMRKHIAQLKESGMPVAQYRDFMETFVGEAENIKGRMAPGEYDKLKTMTAQYAMMAGGDPNVYARMVGRLMLMGPEQGQKAEDVVAKMASFYTIVGKGGGATTQVIDQAVGRMGTLLGDAGQVGSSRALGAMTIAASRLRTGEVGVNIENFANAVTGNLRGPKWTPFIRDELKIKAGTKAEDAMGPVFDWMDEQVKSGKDLREELRNKGLGQKEVMNALIGMRQFRKEMDDLLKEAPVDERAAVRRNIAEFYDPRKNLGGAQARADVRAELQPVERGMESGEGIRRTFMVRAAAELKSQKLTGEDYEATRGLGTQFMDWSLRQLGQGAHDTVEETRRAIELMEQPVEQGGLGMRVSLGGTGRRIPRDRASMGAYTMSNRLQSDIQASLDNPEQNRLYPNAPGAPQGGFTMPEMREIAKTNQDMREYLRSLAVRPHTVPQPRGRVRPT
jgi:hypothetical protein